MKKRNKGFSLIEVVTSIVVFTLLTVVLLGVVPPLIMKFRTTVFKEQAVLLAKSKLEEYIYAPTAVPYTSGTQRFAAPNADFWYSVSVSSFSGGSNMGLVNVSVWGPTTNSSQTSVNRVNLVGLAKAAEDGNGIQLVLNPGGISSFYTPMRFSSFANSFNYEGQVSPFGQVFNIYGGLNSTYDYWAVIHWYYLGNSNPNGLSLNTYAFFDGNSSESYDGAPLSLALKLLGLGNGLSSGTDFYRIWGLAFDGNNNLYVSNMPQSGSTTDTTMRSLINLDGRMATLDKIRDTNPALVVACTNSFRDEQASLYNSYWRLLPTKITAAAPYEASGRNKGFNRSNEATLTRGIGKITVDSQNNFYVIDLAGTYVRKYSSTGSAMGGILDKTKYGYATKVRTDSAGNVYIYDRLNNKIVFFDRNGVYRNALNSSNVRIPGVTNFKIGDFAVDDDGHIFVINRPAYNSDWTRSTSDKIYQINSDGSHVKTNQSTLISGDGAYPITSVISLDCKRNYLTCAGIYYGAGNAQNISTQVYKMQE